MEYYAVSEMVVCTLCRKFVTSKLLQLEKCTLVFFSMKAAFIQSRCMSMLEDAGWRRCMHTCDWNSIVQDLQTCMSLSQRSNNQEQMCACVCS